jgi:PAS domain S-box-containing protein
MHSGSRVNDHAMAVTDLSGTVLTANDLYLRLLGTNSEPIIGADIWACMEEEYEDTYRAIVKSSSDADVLVCGRIVPTRQNEYD